MSYAVGHVFYGWDLTVEYLPDLLHDWDDDEDSGIRTWYSGNSTYTPMGLGVKLLSFDECDNFRLREIQKSPTVEQKEKVALMKRRLLDRETLTEVLRDYFPDLESESDEEEMIDEVHEFFTRHLAEEPDIWIIWGSS